MRITWDNIDDFKLRKVDIFRKNRQCYDLKEGLAVCIICKEPYFSVRNRPSSYCSSVCFYKHKAATAVEVQCLWCGTTLSKSLNVVKANKNGFACSKKCSSKLKSLKYGCTSEADNYICVTGSNLDRYLGFCIYCGGSLNMKRKRLFCSKSCKEPYDYLIYINKWLLGVESGTIKDGALSKYIKNYLLDLHNSECQVCGWGEINILFDRPILEVHHIDGDAYNNRPTNLQLLCPNCHTLTNNFGALNRGKSSRVYK